MKVYLSARFAEAPRLRAFRDLLVAHGFESTARWLDGEPQDNAAIAAMDEADVKACDVLVNFTTPPSPEVVGVLLDERGPAGQPYAIERVMPGTISRHPNASRGGRHVEFGMARMLGKVCIVTGPRENVFHWADGVHVCAAERETLQLLLWLRATLAFASAIGLDPAEQRAIALTYGVEIAPPETRPSGELVYGESAPDPVEIGLVDEPWWDGPGGGE